MKTSPKENTSISISAVDLFCGVGGLTHGLEQTGINVVAGIDVDPMCKYAYEKNNKAEFIQKDIRQLTSIELSKLYPSTGIKLLVGCAPCQPFSSHTRKYKDRHQDKRWDLLYDFGRLIEEGKPDIVVFENVTPIRKERVYKDFVEKFDSFDYDIWEDMIYCPDYGIPQKRRRLVLIASVLGRLDPLSKTHSLSGQHGLAPYQTVKDAIGELPPIDAGHGCESDHLHRSCKLLSKNMERIKQSKAGGTWEDWDEDLRVPCHRKPSGKTYKSVYGRMKWDEPSPTITTQFHNYGTGRFGHPEQHRALSFREGALLQTFPMDYDFVDPDIPLTIKRIGTYIGNAVPVKLATIIGENIQRHVEDHIHG